LRKNQFNPQFVIFRPSFAENHRKMGSVLIESRLVGKLIGPRGATIQQLQSEYNVHISISKEDDQVRNRRALENSPMLIENPVFRTETALLRSEDLTTMFRTPSQPSKKDFAKEVEVAVAATAASVASVEVAAAAMAASAVTETLEDMAEVVADTVEAKADTNNENKAATSNVNKAKAGAIVAATKVDKEAVKPGNFMHRKHSQAFGG
jgi:KH domain